MAGYVISGRELATIRSRASLGAAGTSVLAPPVDMAHHARAEKRKEASNARAGKWPNTLTALRQRKEQARFERLERAEAARRVIDEEEAVLRLERDAEVLDMARRKLVENTDKMKMLRSNKMLIHANLVREKQIAQKERRKAAIERRDQLYHEKVMEKLREEEEAEAAAAVRTAERALEVQVMLKQQLGEAQHAARARMEEEKLEGRRIRRAAEEAAAEEEAAELARRETQRRNNEDMQAVNKELQQIKLKQAEKEEEEARALERYAADQEAKAIRRRDFVLAKRAAAEARAAEMRSIIEKQFSAAMANENERLDREQEDARKKEETRVATKEADRALLQSQIDASRAAQVQRRKGAKERSVTEDKANAAKWNGVIYSLEKEEYEAQRLARKKARDLMLENRRAARSRAEALIESEEKEREADVAALGITQHGDEAFQVAATKLLGDEVGAGRRVDFLERAILRSQKEKLIAADADM
jgi:hypothetical protein